MAEPEDAEARAPGLDPELARELEPERWKRSERRAILYLRRRFGCTLIEATDLVSMAWDRIRAGAYPWDRARLPAFARFLCRTVYSIRGNTLTKAQNRREAAIDEERDEEAPTSIPSPESASIEKAEQNDRLALRAELLASLPEEHLARKVLALVLAGEVTKAEDVAARLGVPPAKIHAAVKDLTRRGRPMRDRMLKERAKAEKAEEKTIGAAARMSK